MTLKNEDFKNNISIDHKELEKIIEQIKQVVEELPEEKRGEILESLEQKSFKGRVNYLNRLFHLSGSDLTITAQS